MKIVVLSALGNAVAQQCITSLFETTTSIDFHLFLVREKGFREQTLNFALSLVGTDEDILFVGDDIEFTPGWYAAFMDNYDMADIIGFSMLYPETDKVQNTGYDLVSIDDNIILSPRNYGKSKNEVRKFKSHPSDTITGCAMFIKKRVFKKVHKFPLDGMNRWGENLFIHKAIRYGFKVIVLGHFLYHHGKSTKANSNLKYRSESYSFEKQQWSKLAKKYIDNSLIKKRYMTKLSDSFNNVFSSSKRILLYGAGTVSELIVKKLRNDPIFDKITICSGLQEEDNLEFYGIVINHINNIEFNKYDSIIITIIAKEIHVYNNIKSKIYKNDVYYVHQEKKANIIEYSLHDIQIS